MSDDEQIQQRDEIRCQSAVQTVLDVLMRFEESNEGSYGVYDILSYVSEELIREGFCPACIQDSLNAAAAQSGASLATHTDTGTVH